MNSTLSRALLDIEVSLGRVHQQAADDFLQAVTDAFKQFRLHRHRFQFISGGLLINEIFWWNHRLRSDHPVYRLCAEIDAILDSSPPWLLYLEGRRIPT